MPPSDRISSSRSRIVSSSIAPARSTPQADPLCISGSVLSPLFPPETTLGGMFFVFGCCRPIRQRLIVRGLCLDCAVLFVHRDFIFCDRER